MTAVDAMAELLAERHRRSVEGDPDSSLLNYAESARSGDWTLRSALVRLAQPEPMRASAVVDLIRRLDAALHPHTRGVLQHTTLCDRALSMASLRQIGDRFELDDPTDATPDGRVTDLARLASRDPEAFAPMLDSYIHHNPLVDAELAALPLLEPALLLDGLAEELTRWADSGFRDPPLQQVDSIGRAVATHLDRLGVPVDQGAPPRGGRRG